MLYPHKNEGIRLMKKLAIFDLDGTLINTLETISYFVNTTLAYYGIEAIETETFKVLAGDGARNLIRRSLALRLKEWEEDFETEVLKRYNEAYDADFMKLCKVYDLVPEMLSGLKKAGYSLAVLTNKPEPTAVKTIQTLFGLGFFDMVCGQRAGIPLKPQPDGAFLIIETCKAKKEHTLYVGDTATDMKTGKAAGLYTVGVLWGFRKEEELRTNGADLIIKKPSELLQYVESISDM